MTDGQVLTQDGLGARRANAAVAHALGGTVIYARTPEGSEGFRVQWPGNTTGFRQVPNYVADAGTALVLAPVLMAAGGLTIRLTPGGWVAAGETRPWSAAGRTLGEALVRLFAQVLSLDLDGVVAGRLAPQDGPRWADMPEAV